MENIKRQALGLIETKGYTPLVAAVDSGLKAAAVSLVSPYLVLVGSGLAMAAIEGDVGSVSAALHAAQATLKSLGAPGMTHLIPRPDPAIWEMLRQDGLKVDEPPPSQPLPSGETSTTKGENLPSSETSSTKGESLPSRETSSTKGESLPSRETSTTKGESLKSRETPGVESQTSITPGKNKSTGQNSKKLSLKAKKSRKPS